MANLHVVEESIEFGACVVSILLENAVPNPKSSRLQSFNLVPDPGSMSGLDKCAMWLSDLS